MRPRSGDVLLVGWAASVQFATPILFRVIRVHDWMTYDGWLWADGYEINSAGEAIERRSIFVQEKGLRKVGTAADRRPGVPPAMGRPATPPLSGGSPDRPASPPPGATPKE
ncbi:hypothetical protein [Actinoplanes sp. HUAS TT8]|uniref:hypothetical protein n=1 Tax=Actinoplanes sp. HUAS TT8 TaxID=3447453 RepID=UPI003F51ED7A